MRRLGLGAGISRRVGTRNGPALDLNFLSVALDSRVTFARAGTAWAYSSSGVLTSYAPDTPRFDYDPVTRAPKGLLIEEARTNLFAGDVTIAANWPAVSISRASGATAPDASANGVTLTESASGTTSYGVNSTSKTITASTATTCSIFVKAGTGSWLRIILSDSTTPTIGAHAYFDVVTGVVGTTGVQSSAGGVPTGISATITAVGDSWYRCTLTATLATATTGVMLLRMTSADNTSTDTGSKTMIFFGPQLEVGSWASSPIVTTTAAATRAVDICHVPTSAFPFNAAAGTLFAEFTPSGVAGLQTVVYLDDTTNNERMGVRSSAGTNAMLAVDGGATQVNASVGSVVAGMPYKVAMSYVLNDFAGCQNGGTVATDTVVTLPTVTRFLIGSRLSGSEVMSGHYRQARYWPTRRSNTDLQALTV